MSSPQTEEQAKLQALLNLLSELQSKGKITGAQFREYRDLWIKQQPNDRDLTVWQLKQLNEKVTGNPPTATEPTKKWRRQKL